MLFFLPQTTGHRHVFSGAYYHGYQGANYKHPADELEKDLAKKLDQRYTGYQKRQRRAYVSQKGSFVSQKSKFIHPYII